MSTKVTFDHSKTAPFVRADEVAMMEAQTTAAAKILADKSGAGNDFLGWIDLPVAYDKDEFARIKEAAKQIREDSEVLIVIGIVHRHIHRYLSCKLLLTRCCGGRSRLGRRRHRVSKFTFLPGLAKEYILFVCFVSHTFFPLYI